MQKKRLYERYHSKRNLQDKVINNDDYTYRTLIALLNKYSFNKERVLDIGCGVGTIDFFLASMGKRVLGVDISKNGISVALRSSSNLGLENMVNFIVGDVSDLDINEQFDLIICSEVLEHIVDDHLIVTKMKKLLKKNGIIITSSPSSNAPLYKLGMLEKFDKEVGHIRRYTESEFVSLFESSGFSVLEKIKTEGIIRNFFFTNSFGGFMLRFLKRWPFSKLISFLDDMTIPILGESNIYLVLKKK